MAIGFIVAIVIIAIAIGLGVGAYKCYDNDSPVGTGICVTLCIISCLAFIIVPFSFHTINTGEVAVVKHLGKVTHVRDAGTCFDPWMVNSYAKYDTKVQNVDVTTMAYSSDAQTMDIAMTLQYQIMVDKVMDIATQYGSLKTLEGRIQSIAIEKTKSVLSGYKAMDIIANRATISPAVEQAIKDAIGEEYFVNVTAVVLTNIDFSDAFELAVEEKMIAEQAKLKADYENQTKVAQAEAEAQAKLKAAEAEIEIAKAQAEAKKIAAEAEAAANKTIADSITPEILEKMFYEMWNGELPKVMGNGEYILPSDILG
jgi:regulator of protease activity HflC (stomatin/prohibitin superfamily)